MNKFKNDTQQNEHDLEAASRITDMCYSVNRDMNQVIVILFPNTHLHLKH
jgi:hypothetical protein